VNPSLEAAGAPSWRAHPRKSLFALASAFAVVCGARDTQAPPPSAEPARLAAQSLLIALATAGPRLVAVGDRGIIVLSDDKGASWLQAASVPTQALLTGVCFLDARHGVAVGHDEVILTTADGGRTWQRTHYGPEAQRPLLDVWCGAGNRVIAVGAYSTYLTSADGGATWRDVSFTPAPRPTAPAPMRAAATAPAADPGGGEAGAAGGGYHLNRIVSGAGARLYIAAEAGHLYRSDDSGATWQELASPYEGSFFDVLPLSDGGVLALGLRGNLYRSEDAGESWQRIATGTVEMLDGGASFAGAGVAIVGLSGVVLISRDGGHTFTLVQQSDRSGLSAALSVGDEMLAAVGEHGAQVIALANASVGAGAAH
jgi:photosystem II stability/assembly factor-like uncharacterized protein